MATKSEISPKAREDPREKKLLAKKLALEKER
jgi:hypothetical protein